MVRVNPDHSSAVAASRFKCPAKVAAGAGQSHPQLAPGLVGGVWTAWRNMRRGEPSTTIRSGSAVAAAYPLPRIQPGSAPIVLESSRDTDCLTGHASPFRPVCTARISGYLQPHDTSKIMIKSIAKLTLSLGVLGLFATVAPAQGRDGSSLAGPNPAPTRSMATNSGPGSAHFAWADVLRVDPIYETVSVTRPRRECHDEQVVERHQGNGTAGAVLGAVVGGYWAIPLARATDARPPPWPARSPAAPSVTVPRPAMTVKPATCAPVVAMCRK